MRPDVLAPPRSLCPDLSPTIEGAILAAMAPHPGNRPPTVHAWLGLLRADAVLTRADAVLTRADAVLTRAEAVPFRTQQAMDAPSAWRTLWRESGWLLVAGALLTALALYLDLR